VIQQGEIYLVDFGTKYNSELGKIRPGVVMQNNMLNLAVQEKIYRQILVVPFSSLPIEDDYRIRIKARERLHKDSYIVSNWACTIDFSRIQLERGVIARLTPDEIDELKKRICALM